MCNYVFPVSSLKTTYPVCFCSKFIKTVHNCLTSKWQYTSPNWSSFLWVSIFWNFGRKLWIRPPPIISLWSTARPRYSIGENSISYWQKKTMEKKQQFGSKNYLEIQFVLVFLELWKGKQESKLNIKCVQTNEKKYLKNIKKTSQIW